MNWLWSLPSSFIYLLILSCHSGSTASRWVPAEMAFQAACKDQLWVFFFFYSFQHTNPIWEIITSGIRMIVLEMSVRKARGIVQLPFLQIVWWGAKYQLHQLVSGRTDLWKCLQNPLLAADLLCNFTDISNKPCNYIALIRNTDNNGISITALTCEAGEIQSLVLASFVVLLIAWLKGADGCKLSKSHAAQLLLWWSGICFSKCIIH